jgi:hypothetical protein
VTATAQPFNFNRSFDSQGYLALDGGRVLVGLLRDDTNGRNVGRAQLFDINTGNLLLTFDDPTPSPSVGSEPWVDKFGDAVALDGNHVLIGAPYDDTNGEKVEQQTEKTRTNDSLATANR